MNQMYIKIDELIRANRIHRFKDEIDYLEKLGDPEQSERKKVLNYIITSIESIKNAQTIKQEKVSDHITILRETLYKKKWHLLNSEQKINRINLFAKTHKLTDDVLNKLITYLNETGLKNKDLEYDTSIGIITNIFNLNQILGVESSEPVVKSEKDVEGTVKKTRSKKKTLSDPIHVENVVDNIVENVVDNIVDNMVDNVVAIETKPAKKTKSKVIKNN
jgi:hemerythrin